MTICLFGRVLLLFPSINSNHDNLMSVVQVIKNFTSIYFFQSSNLNNEIILHLLTQTSTRASLSPSISAAMKRIWWWKFHPWKKVVKWGAVFIPDQLSWPLKAIVKLIEMTNRRLFRLIFTNVKITEKVHL